MQRLFDEVWNGRRFEVIDELYAPEYVADHRPYAPLREGRDAVREMVERAWTTTPDYHEELIAMVGEGDVVAVRLSAASSTTSLGSDTSGSCRPRRWARDSREDLCTRTLM